MSQALEVATPERVAIELPIAGLGSRSMAYVIDVSLLGAVALVAYFGLTFFIPDPVNAALGLSSLVRTLGGIAIFFALWGYWTVFEVLWNGQTLGKRLVRIRVVRADGTPITVFASAARNLLRIIDFMPACYPVGLTAMLIDRKNRRLGDLVAGTVLVRDEQVDLSRYAEVQSTALAVNEIEIASSFLARFAELDAGPRLRIARKLCERLGLPIGDDVESMRVAIAGKLAAP